MQFNTDKELAAHLEANPFLTSLEIAHSGITALDLSGHQSLTSLTVSHCPELETLGDYPANLVFLRVNNLPKVRKLSPLRDGLNDAQIYACPSVPRAVYV